MSHVSLLHQAKQGDSQAIANLLNQSLSYKKVQITEATLEDNCLKLKLDSRSVPNQHKLIPFIKEEVTSLRLEVVQTLHIEAYVTGVEQAAWQTTLTLEEHTQRIAEFSHILSAKSDEVETEEVSLELRAKRGDQSAVLELFNLELEPKNITAKIRFNKGYLQVLVLSDDFIEKKETVQLIRNKLIEARLPLIKKVTVYGKQTEEEIPLWHESFENSSKSIENSGHDLSTHHDQTNQQESPSLLNKFLNFKK